MYPSSYDPDAFHKYPFAGFGNRLTQPVIVFEQMTVAMFVHSGTHVRNLQLLDQTPETGVPE